MIAAPSVPARAIMRFGTARSHSATFRSIAKILSRHTANAIMKQAGIAHKF
jgi:hypothetical protein